MKREQVSIIVEIFAFFLVTIDLYGEARLLRLSRWLSLRNPTLNFSRKLASNVLYIPKKFLDMVDIKPTSRWPIMVMLVIIWVDYYYISDYTAVTYTNKYWNFIFDAIIAVVAFPLSLLAVVIGGFIVTLVASAVVISLIMGSSYLVARLNLSGWMLLFGALFFLFAKWLAFTAAPAELAKTMCKAGCG
jgi:hypothetical protein